ncbi:FAD-dependent oxidoreductase [Tropicimonas sp. IMCC34011]|uniref:FAD-dependent oxidoreductase n=1 Tax=Tropicimonas sp. IMCC34011 TaxID=2248759 RepID=UPI000E280EB6|nr:FAD-dependent oxidoreductase [Tropicimonas sp. IMCC34011]
MTKHDIGSLQSIEENTPVKADAGGTDILIIRRGDEVTALAHACPHFGLPLSKGYLDGDRLICAFHHACFDVGTGKQTEPPGHGDLRRYEVEVRDGRVLVEVEDGAEAHLEPAFTTRGADTRRFVIVGSGAAADAAALTLRENGFSGAIAMISPEEEAPYDRTLMSKAVLAGGDSPRGPTITGTDMLAARDIERVRGTVRAVSPEEKTLSLEDGGTEAFDALLVAPGGTLNTLGAPGEDLPGIHGLRSRVQAERIAKEAEGARRAVIVGGGFIGLEAALSLAKRDIDVTVVLRDPVPMRGVVGERVGRAIRAEHEAEGVTFVEGEVTGFEGKARVSAARLKSGDSLEADLVLVAIGVTPATARIDGLNAEADGGVVTGPDLSVPGAPGLFAAGDVAQVPTAWGRVRIEHWRVARQHGMRAARAMIGERVEEVGVPFFWTALKRQYRYLGHAEDWDEIVIDGAPEDGGDFVARYIKGGKVMALFGAGRDAEIAEAHARMIREGGPLDR